LPKIEEASYKFKNHERFIFRPRCIHTGQKTGLKISCDSPFKGWEEGLRKKEVHLIGCIKKRKIS
jgi:hypothetical protein